MRRFVLLTSILMVGLMAPAAIAQQQAAEGEDTVSDSPKLQEGKDGTRNTPFGRVRQDANPPPAPKPEKPSETGLVSAQVKGDTVTFRKKTPFGNQVWTKKRSELSEDEKLILANPSNTSKKSAAAKVKPATAPKPAPQPKPTEEVAAKPQ